MKVAAGPPMMDAEVPCPYVGCAGTVVVQVECRWADGRAAGMGTCSRCRRVVEVADGVEQPALDLDA